MEGLISIADIDRLSHLDALRFNAYLDMREDIEAMQAEEAKARGNR